jgi:hypothetical protein
MNETTTSVVCGDPHEIRETVGIRFNKTNFATKIKRIFVGSVMGHDHFAR